jgi:GAF domain-containing protein
LLQGCGRRQGSLLFFNPPDTVMAEHEVVPATVEPLNSIVVASLGSIAYRLSQTDKIRVIEDLAGEVFFGSMPEGMDGLASLLVAPLVCDGKSFGVLLAYGRLDEPQFDASETEYWTTAATLVGLSMHWRALRQNQGTIVMPGAENTQGGARQPQE